MLTPIGRRKLKSVSDARLACTLEPKRLDVFGARSRFGSWRERERKVVRSAPGPWRVQLATGRATRLNESPDGGESGRATRGPKGRARETESEIEKN